MNSRSFLSSLLLLIILAAAGFNMYGQKYIVKSPGKNLEMHISSNDTLTWSVFSDGRTLIKPSGIFLNLDNGISPGLNPEVINAEESYLDETITADVPVKNKVISNLCNELLLKCSQNYNIRFRVYDDGIAYRFETEFDKNMHVISEHAEFNFEHTAGVIFPEEKAKNYISHYERSYKDTLLNSVADSQYCSLPVMVYDKNFKFLITEADLCDYPNMFLYGTGNPGLTAAFPRVILETKYLNDRDEGIIKSADFIASAEGKRTFPWRTVIIVKEDKQLLESEMVFKLSSPSVLNNSEWIKPGRVAWDWWNDNNIYGVDFESGINTETYKYYIDFASEFGLEYIILDEGWSATTHDLLNTKAEIDLPELIRHGKEKNVGIILWVLWNALNKDMEKILDSFAAWDVQGVKVDFMQRADQDMVNFYERCAAEAAKRKLIVDFHGAYKPSGLNRKYPNVLSFEGLKGLEQSKWGNDITPQHDVTLPFIRMTAGPMDYTPGAMINAPQKSFRPVFSEPMSQGTRCHQAAMYVVYTSPLQMFCDNPSNYLRDSVYTKFISRIPSVWDETVGLESKTGEYVSVARRKGDAWYIGVMTDWTSRNIELPLSFLSTGKYKIEYLQDGINATRHASDYKTGENITGQSDLLKVSLASGGGYVCIITPLTGF